MSDLLRYRGPLSALSARERSDLLSRQAEGRQDLRDQVAPVIEDVRLRGDAALREYTTRFDRVSPAALEVPREAIRAAVASIDPAVRGALERARDNLARAHRAWLPSIRAIEVEPGLVLERRPIPLGRVGVYAPGGRAAYPSSVLMGAVPARVAGVREVVLCSPPGPDGLPHAAVLAAADIAGVDRVFALGGAQAVAALAFGTETVPRVDRIVGPGNAFVTEAKLQVAQRVGIDNPAGPSEILIVADAATDPALVAAEMVAQAEHDPDAVAVAIVVGDDIGPFEAALAAALAGAPRHEIVAASLARSGGVLSVADLAAAVTFANEFAAEHLLLASEAAVAVRDQFVVAGAIFVGAATSVAFGDYLTGGNHVLPTSGLARSYSGLGTEDFIRWVTYQTASSAAAARLAADTVVLATAEGLPGHATAAARWRSA